MFSSALTSARGPRRRQTRSIALLSGLVLLIGSNLTVSAATDTKPYTALWNGTSSSTTIASGTSTVHLWINNQANPQTLGSANITVPTGYTLNSGSVDIPGGSATKSGGTLQVRNLNLAPGATVDVTMSVTTPCLAGGPAGTWAVIVKQANSFSGPPGNDFVNAGSAPTSTVAGTSTCQLRFANQPNTTVTGNAILSGYNSTGSGIKVEIFDPATNQTVNSTANVSLALSFNPASGTLTGGGATAAVAGTATFSSLSVNKPGPYQLRASSAAASNHPDSNQFMVSDTVDTCQGTGCSFTQNQANNTYTLKPNKGAAGAQFVSTLNLPGLKISCQFDPYNYSDARQPNAVWYTYDDGDTQSLKTNVIVIDKSVVQLTPENGASKYRVCYSSPVRFTDRNGNLAPEDPWITADTDGNVGPSVYFGQTWYTGLLPDCGNKKVPPAPCVIGWTGDSAGNRVGTFVTPPGDPSYR